MIIQKTADALCKVKLNSTYGKLGWASEHDIANHVTCDTKFLLEQFALGNITKISKINERYTSYSGVQVSDCKRTNFMLASYITARGRLQLIDTLKAFDAAGLTPIYSDTDSVYAQITDKATPELHDKFIKPLLDETKLGAMKLEMHDNVGEDEAEGVFIAPKLYALRGKTTGKEKIVARGVMKWMFGDKERDEKRRKQEGQEKVTFNHLAEMLEGVPLEITRQQTLIRKNLLTTDAQNIKIQREMTTLVRGHITKKIVRDDGVCVPLLVDGQVQAPKPVDFEEKWVQFPDTEQIESYFGEKFNDVADRYCTIRRENGTNNMFIVFLDSSTVSAYLEKFNTEKKCHQIFGKWMQPSFDVDYPVIEGEELDTDVSKVVQKLAKKLEIGVEEFKVVDRSRQGKVSYHIRAPRFCIQRDELRWMAMDVMKDERQSQKGLSVLQCLDLNIYHNKG